MARSPSAHALRWVSCLPFAVRELYRFRLVALPAHTAPLPIAPRAPALSIPATGPHAHKAIARPLPFPTTTGLAPQLVLAGIATSVAISFNILLPVVPVLMERRGPHGAAGAATAALFVGAVAGEVLTPWLMSRWSSPRPRADSAWASRSWSPWRWSESSPRPTGAGVPWATLDSP